MCCETGIEVAGFVVDDARYLGQPTVDGKPVQLWSDKQLNGTEVALAIGDSAARKRIGHSLGKVNARLAEALISPRAILAPNVRIGRGAILAGGSTFSVGVTVGVGAYININCSISHDVSVGDWVTIAPGVTIAGHVEISDDVTIGIGATVINGTAEKPLRIGRGAVIGAGSCIIRDVHSGQTVVGVPGRPIRVGA